MVRLEDGTYQVTMPYFCAGFTVVGGEVVRCAPILRLKLAYWMTKAKKVAGPMHLVPKNG